MTSLVFLFEKIMPTRSLPVTMTLVLTLLAVLPSSYIGLSRVHAFNQDVSIFTTSLPFGPESDQIIFQYYGDISTMFNAFTAGGSGGGIDITDWPIPPMNSGIQNPFGSLCDASVYPDFYCSSPRGTVRALPG
jgi:ABC-type transport system substrate-binding protein